MPEFERLIADEPLTQQEIGKLLYQEHKLSVEDRLANKKARHRLLTIIYSMSAILLVLGILSVAQQFRNKDLAEGNAEAIEAIQASRVQVTYDLCVRQDERVEAAVARLALAQQSPIAKQIAGRVAHALGLSTEQYAAYQKANAKTTADLVATITLDPPVVQTPDGPRRDCERTIVERFGAEARRADAQPAAKKRIEQLLRAQHG